MSAKDKTEGDAPAPENQGSGDVSGPELNAPGATEAITACSICGAPAVGKTDGKSANPVGYCELDTPANVELVAL